LLILAVVLVGGIMFMKTQDKAEKLKSFRTSTWWEYIQVIAVAFVLVFGFMRPFVVEAFKIPSASMEDTLLIGDRILVAKFVYGITVPFVKLPRCSIGSEFRHDLDNETVSQSLRKEFEDKLAPLSQNAAVSVQKIGNEWLIADDNNTYTVRRKRDKLKVYTKLHILDFHRPEVGDIFVFKPPARAGKTQNFIKRIVGVPGDIIEIRNGDLYRNGKAVVGEDYVKRYPSALSTLPSYLKNRPPVKVPPGCVFAMGDNRDKSHDSRAWGFVPFENIKGQAFLTYWSWDRDGDWLHKIRFRRIGHRVK
jgi:signal peptidase I